MKLNLKEIDLMVASYNKGREFKSNRENFIYDAKRYIKAVKEGRLICSIDSVSRSGMSRTLKFVEMAKCKKPFYKPYAMLNFYNFFLMLEYTPARDSGYFRISGCGMDMVFHTNYSIIRTLYRLGFMDGATCEKLAQCTPNTI